MADIDDIVEVGDIPKHPIITLYGPEGVGKTILASKLSDNNLIVATERSVVSLSNFPELANKTRILRLKTFDRFTKLIAQIYNGEVEADHLIIDTIPGITNLKLGEQLRKVNFNRKHPDVNSLEDYQLLKEHMKPVFTRLAMLDISVTFIAHMRIPQPDQFGKGDKLVRPDVPFEVFRLMNGITNLTAYMQKVNSKEKGLLRVLQVESDDTYVAKTHIPMNPRVTDEDFVEIIRNWKGI